MAFIVKKPFETTRASPAQRVQAGARAARRLSLEVTVSSTSTGEPTGSTAELPTATHRIHLRPDGIVQTTTLGTREMTLADAKENVRAVVAVSGGVRRPVYVDTTIPSPITKEAQAQFTSVETAVHIS